jgi:hypothetical protein
LLSQDLGQVDLMVIQQTRIRDDDKRDADPKGIKNRS